MFQSLWYQNLTKPFLAPPDWIFRPVWLFLYLTMIFAFVLYFFKNTSNKKTGYFYFIVQILLNIIWTPVFFGLKNIFLALITIILLDIFVFLTIRKFYTISKLSGIILIPYFLWILFATYLNIGYWILN